MTVLETVVIPFNYIPIIMEESGFEPPNPKERFYRPSRLTRLRYSSIISGAGRNRTADTRSFNPLLYQLSYRAVLGLNLQLIVVMEDTGLEPVTLCL